MLLCRAGWCPGTAVRPWVADVSAALAPAGQPNSIVYRGLYNGSGRYNGSADPEEGQLAAYIMMESSLVLYYK